jgi:hypothetical protein
MLYAIKQTACLIVLSVVFAATIVVSSGRTLVSSGATQEVQSGAASAIVEGQAERDSATILGSARTIYIWSRTFFVKQEVIESALLKRDDYRRSGLLITKDKDAADLILTVRRANFTTEYPYDVVDQKTKLVVAGGKVNSLFGTAAGKIAGGFMKQIQRARSGAAGRH